MRLSAAAGEKTPIAIPGNVYAEETEADPLLLLLRKERRELRQYILGARVDFCDNAEDG